MYSETWFDSDEEFIPNKVLVEAQVSASKLFFEKTKKYGFAFIASHTITLLD